MFYGKILDDFIFPFFHQKLIEIKVFVGNNGINNIDFNDGINKIQ